MAAWWVLSITWHLVFRGPKGDHNFDKHTCASLQSNQQAKLCVRHGQIVLQDEVYPAGADASLCCKASTLIVMNDLDTRTGYWMLQFSVRTPNKGRRRALAGLIAHPGTFHRVLSRTREWRSSPLNSDRYRLRGCFYKLGVRFVGVLVRALLFGAYVKAPEFWKLARRERMQVCSKTYAARCGLLILVWSSNFSRRRCSCIRTCAQERSNH